MIISSQTLTDAKHQPITWLIPTKLNVTTSRTKNNTKPKQRKRNMMLENTQTSSNQL